MLKKFKRKTRFLLFYGRVWQVRYNVFHDQLVLSAGSDARVVLTSAASLSSEPFGKLMSDDKDNDDGDLFYIQYANFSKTNLKNKNKKSN